MKIIDIMIMFISSYGFAIAVQMIRNGKLNFKPFSCKACCGFWFSIAYLITPMSTIKNIISYSLSAFCVSYILSRTEDKLFNNNGPKLMED